MGSANIRIIYHEECRSSRFGGSCLPATATIDTLTPTVLPLGENVKITGSGTIPDEVTGGEFTANIKSSIGGIQIVNCKGPIGPVTKCNLLFGAGSVTLDAIATPVEPGKRSISLDVELNSHVPSYLLSTKIEVRATDQNGKAIVCMDLATKPKDEAVVV